MATNTNFYTNPAFCQQSEYPPRVLSPKSVRQSPVGAQCVQQNREIGAGRSEVIVENLQEQEFYEEVLVDDKGFITDKKFVVVAQNNEGKKYIQVPQNEDRHGSRYGLASPFDDRKGARYGIPAAKPKLTRSQSQRYEYIQMQEQSTSPTRRPHYLEDVEVPPARFHRYAVIEPEEETELSNQNTRYALVPVDHLNNFTGTKQTPVQSKPRYEYIQNQPAVQEPENQPHSPNRYESLSQNPNRYEYVQSTPQKPQFSSNYTNQSPRPSNLTATQKLHEILSTPKKTPNQLFTAQSGQKLIPQLSPINKEYPKKPPPRAQQKLNYALGVNHAAQAQDKRHLAIVAPMCSSPIQSVYSETTFSKSGSWSNLSVKAPVQATLTFAAMVLFVCGIITSGLCFYLIYLRERQYYLDFGVVAGFTCMVLGLLGFRSRRVYWLPNRNYISGYIILSVFSLSTCVALLILLVKQPKKGSPLADMTSGAVCGFSVLSLILATMGVVSSYCCKYPPPDNRVQHCAEGFRV